MSYDHITDLKEIERELTDLSWQLDASEHDPEEYEEALDRLYPDEVKKAAKRASELGSTQGMHLYGRMLQYEACQLKKEGKPYEELQARAKELVMQAASNGCWGAMDDLGTEYVEELNSSMSEQLAFIQLSGQDPLEHIKYLRERLGLTVTQDEIDKGLQLYEAIHRQMVENGIEKKQCYCIFP
ncbi:hypothetical protein [uncultured Thiodictyon sp.]|uniref:hypothetical protein n=1 Tax=uncultured Thiodictyon sp. TaxID=1846217 RepID=UPI0025E90F76|nr:hypothetical protein [uncultured Thiodictyon sp.]